MINKVLSKNRKSSRFSLIYNASFVIISVVLSIFIALKLLSAEVPVFSALLHTVISFLSITAIFIIPKPFFKSFNWFYKLLFYVLYCIVMYLSSRNYVMSCYANNEYYITKWSILWVRPVLIYYAVCLIDRLCTSFYNKKQLIGIIWKSWKINYYPFNKKNRNANKSELHFSDIPRTLVFFITSVCITVTVYLKLKFSHADLGVIIYTLKFNSGGINKGNIGVIFILLIVTALVNIIFIANLINKNNAVLFKLTSPDKSESFVMRKEDFKNGILKELPLILLLLFSVFSLMNQVNFNDYINNLYNYSTIYENYYVKPDISLLTFPEKKKNLIYISAESMENSYTSFNNGGIQNIDHIPNLVKLSEKNINFSNGQYLGGQSIFYPFISYTMGSCVAQTSGVSLSLYTGDVNADANVDANVDVNVDENDYVPLPSVVKLENLLSKAGYNQLYIKGDSATFAGANYYFGNENNSKLIDYDYAKEEGWIPEKYFKNWGIEDAKIFDFSRELISQTAQKNEPFAVTIYTMDTHMPEGGFRCELCDPNIQNDQIAAVECSDRQISDFVKWVQEQEFGEDTVIIIYGDHLSHNEPLSLFKQMPSNYVRTTYNCIINSQKEPVNSKNRLFSAMDMYPTTLSALGVTINGDRLGLGTDLFSATPTLCEELGKGEFLVQIQENSEYYKNEFF